MFEVYLHTSPSGKAYVGMTSRGMRHRWNLHVHAARKGGRSVFHRAIRKYGPEAFTHEVLERMTTEAGALQAERLWVARLGTFGPRGYNRSAGGEGAPGTQARRGHTHSAETRAKISASNRARGPKGPMSEDHRAALKRGWEKRRAKGLVTRGRAPGFPVSAETRARTSAACKAAWARKKGGA